MNKCPKNYFYFSEKSSGNDLNADLKYGKNGNNFEPIQHESRSFEIGT